MRRRRVKHRGELEIGIEINVSERHHTSFIADVVRTIRGISYVVTIVTAIETVAAAVMFLKKYFSHLCTSKIPS